MPNNETVHVEYDTTGVPTQLGNGENNYSKNLSTYFYNKMNTISNNGDFTNADITLYGLEVNNDKINISTTKKLINYLKSFVKKNVANINTNLESKISVDDVDDELKDSSNPISNSTVFNKFEEIGRIISNNYATLNSMINDLVTEIATKANNIHMHSMNDVTNLNNTINTINTTLGNKANNSSLNNHINNLNNHINNRNNPHGVTLEQLGFADSGWITFPLYKGTTDSPAMFINYHNDSPIQYRKYGKLVEIRGIAKSKFSLEKGTDGWHLGYLPEGFRPSKEIHAVNEGSSMAKYLMIVQTDGNVRIGARYGTTTNSNVPKDAWLNCYVTFLVD